MNLVRLLCVFVAVSAVSVNAQSVVIKPKTNEKLASAFNTGQLPEPLRKPGGTPDEVAAALAKSVAAGDDQSMPALLAALMTAGFGIRDNEGAVTQTVDPGQGLIFEAWEIAAMAKMYGEGRTVELSYLTGALKSVPELKEAPLEQIILDGIRKQASSRHPELRFWARFITELGRHSHEPYDLLSSEKNIRIDAIQSALILRRVAGDIYVLAQRSNKIASNKIRYAHAFQSQPCRQSDMEATINDIRATALTSGFGGLLSWVESRIGSSGDLLKSYGKFMNVANILLAYAKFIATYAALETEITISNPPLVRITSVGSGQSRQLTAKVSMNIGKWQQVNCFRWLLNAGTGLDFNLMNDGPLEGVGVNWHIVEGGFADAYRSGDLSQQIVQFKGTGPRIQDAGTYAGIPGQGGVPVGNLTETKTDSQGNARILLEGAYRRNYIPKPHTPVMKKAIVMTTIKLKGGDIKGDAVDVAGHLLGGLLTLPAELLYRTDWASTARIEVPVKDWEPCQGQWTGTITYTVTSKREGSGENAANKSSWKEEFYYQAKAQLDGRTDNYGKPLARVDAEGTETKLSESIGKSRPCHREGKQTWRVSGNASETTSAFSITVNPRTGEYSVSAPTIIVPASGESTVSSVIKGTCNNPFNKDVNYSNKLDAAQLSPGGPSVDGKGMIDPADPHAFSGTNSETVRLGGGRDKTVTITWDLKRCQ
jgi:hypothetical protein